MATTADRICIALANAGKPLDDDELAAVLGVRRQAINAECRRMASEGRLVRRVSVGNKIQNALTASAPGPPRVPPPLLRRSSGLLSEDEVKAAVQGYLQGQGYEVTVAWGHAHGIDIQASQPGKRLLIEAKGEAHLQPQQVNYFLGALGELVQRLADPQARYGLALPDNP